MREYANLHALLEADAAARALFMRQPEHVQGGVWQQAYAIHSLQALAERAGKARGMLQ